MPKQRQDEDWPEVNQDVEYEAPTSYVSPPSQPVAKEKVASKKDDDWQDRSPKKGYEHYLVRNIPTETMDVFRDLKKREDRPISWLIIRVLNDYAKQQKGNP